MSLPDMGRFSGEGPDEPNREGPQGRLAFPFAGHPPAEQSDFRQEGQASEQPGESGPSGLGSLVFSDIEAQVANQGPLSPQDAPAHASENDVSAPAKTTLVFQIGTRSARPSWQIPPDAPWEPIDKFLAQAEREREDDPTGIDRGLLAQLMTSSEVPARHNLLSDSRVDYSGYSAPDREGRPAKYYVPPKPNFLKQKPGT